MTFEAKYSYTDKWQPKTVVIHRHAAQRRLAGKTARENQNVARLEGRGTRIGCHLRQHSVSKRQYDM